ncbi:dihydroneopterin aldolase [Piscicoccus intestinalis]|uniref:dihydroneopterin aldolase n=1 Tax=Piscicoccus intestinalis TaxID=746033 RepID=UPI000837F53E|nr:dihydroneopterin aldolase [Piscicoccus intestinalis]
MSPGRDVVELRGVRANGRHGVLAHEKVEPQPFVVDVDLETDLSWAGASDALGDTTSYADVAADIVARLTGPGVDLIERLAHLIAGDCLRHELVEAATVTVHKPQAPVGVEFGDVAVRVRRGQGRTAVVALGGNLPRVGSDVGTEVGTGAGGGVGTGEVAGGVADTLASAALALDALPGTSLRALSPLVASDPMPLPTDPGTPFASDAPDAPDASDALGGAAGPGYLNAVAVLRTDLHPRTLLARLHEIEADHGRVRARRWGPRTLDLDLVQVRGAAGSLRLDGAVRLPHPGAAERAFVIGPWAFVEPEAVREFLADAGVPAPELDGLRPAPAWPAAAARFVRRIGELPAPLEINSGTGTGTDAVAEEHGAIETGRPR